MYLKVYTCTNKSTKKTKYTYAQVNLRPILPGHVLVVPLRTDVVALSNLTQEEFQDFFKVVQLIQLFIRWQYQADSINIAIQDGPESGQSVPHLHTHIIPRYRVNNIGDKIYERLDEWDARRDAYIGSGGREGRKKDEESRRRTGPDHALKPDESRVDRSPDEMREEAVVLKERLGVFLAEHPDIAKLWS